MGIEVSILLQLEVINCLMLDQFDTMTMTYFYNMFLALED